MSALNLTELDLHVHKDRAARESTSRPTITMQVGVGQEPEAYLTQQRTTLAYEQNYTPLIDSSQGSRAANEDADYGPSRPIRSHSNAVAYPVAPRSRVPKARARPHQSPYEFTPLG